MQGALPPSTPIFFIFKSTANKKAAPQGAAFCVLTLAAD